MVFLYVQEDLNVHTSSATTHIDPTSSQHVILGENSPGYTADGEIISSQTVSSKTRTVETITVSAPYLEPEWVFDTNLYEPII